MEQLMSDRLRELEASLEQRLLAPPRGGGVVLPAPVPATFTAAERAAYVRLEGKSPGEAVGAARTLLDYTAGALEGLAGPPPGTDPGRADRLAVGKIRLLWGGVPAGRLLLRVWEDEIVNARELRLFACALGCFPSATHAVQELAETVLARLWAVGGPDDEDGPFEPDGPVPAFRVDGW